MGQTLSEPVTAKETSSCGNSFVKVGSSCMQGWRINMEDAHTHLLAVPEDKDACFFAVFDGHGGAKVAQYAGNHLHKKIIQSESYAQGKIEDAIREGFLRLDEDMIKDEQMKDEMAGTTAVIVLIKNGKIFCGNVGDSRAIGSVGGLAEPLSYDHKPANEMEAKRIIAAGGWVEFNRVNGNLALSRALGDFIFKRNDEKPPEEQIVTAFPDVIVKSLSSDWEFILLACDGIWDVMSNQEVVDFCRERLASGMEPEAVCEELLNRCLAPDCQMGGLGCDNMTVVLACMLQNRPWEELKRKCSRPRPPTPTQSNDDVIPTSAVTPPSTPVNARHRAAAAAAVVVEGGGDDVTSKKPSAPLIGVDESSLGDNATSMHEQQRSAATGHKQGDAVESFVDGDQTVPEIPPGQGAGWRPAKQGKLDERNIDATAADNNGVAKPTLPLLLGDVVVTSCNASSTTTNSSTTSLSTSTTVHETSTASSACVPNVDMDAVVVGDEFSLNAAAASSKKPADRGDEILVDNNAIVDDSVVATNPEQRKTHAT